MVQVTSTVYIHAATDTVVVSPVANSLQAAWKEFRYTMLGR